jgi:hypothetical protein
MGRLMVALSCSLLLTGAAMAQRSGGGGGVGGVRSGGMVAAPAVAARVGVAGAARPVSGAAAGRTIATGAHPVRTSPVTHRNVAVSSRFANSTFVSNDSNVPGLGFDYPHLAAVGARRGQSGQRTGFRQTVPFGFGTYLLTTPEIVVENPQAVEEAQETAADQGDLEAQAQIEAAQMRAYRAGQQSVAQHAVAAEAAPEPPADSSSYVFVMRNGGVVFAVAYSWDNGTLRYVTPEGQRMSVAADSLDVDATTQFNESRGLSFRVGA